MRRTTAGSGSEERGTASFRAVTVPDRAIWIVIALGVLLRLVWIGVVHTSPISDFLVYLERAKSITDGFGYAMPDGSPTAYWPVGYPAFLALTLAAGGHHVAAAKLANVMIYVATAGVFRAIARRLRSDGAGFVSVAYLSLSPNHIAYANLLASEPLALLTVAGTFYAVVRLVGAGPPCRWLAAGCACFVAGCYVKPQLFLLPLLLALVTFQVRKDRAVLGRIAVLYAAIIIAVAPWAYRNHAVFGAWVPISTNSGVNLYIGNNQSANGSYVWNQELQAPLAGLNEAEADAKAGALARRHIFQHPFRTLILAVRKQVYLWSTDTEGIGWNLRGMQRPPWVVTAALAGLKILSQLIYMCCLGFSLYGLLHTWKHRRTAGADLSLLWLPLVTVLYYSSLHSLFFGISRFHYVFVPFLFLYADALFVRRDPGVATTRAAPLTEVAA
ncbi:MAG: glycosyltransferase family 39 protein [Rhodospirillaceae bacterium]